MAKGFYRSSGNVFRDVGFAPAEAELLTAKSDLISAIRKSVERRGLTQKQAAAVCHTDQPTLSKVLRGRMESVTLDRLTTWLTELGGRAQIEAHPYTARAVGQRS